MGSEMCIRDRLQLIGRLSPLLALGGTSALNISAAQHHPISILTRHISGQQKPVRACPFGRAQVPKYRRLIHPALLLVLAKSSLSGGVIVSI